MSECNKRGCRGSRSTSRQSSSSILNSGGPWFPGQIATRMPGVASSLPGALHLRHVSGSWQETMLVLFHRWTNATRGHSTSKCGESVPESELILHSRSCNWTGSTALACRQYPTLGIQEKQDRSTRGSAQIIVSWVSGIDGSCTLTPLARPIMAERTGTIEHIFVQHMPPPCLTHIPMCSGVAEHQGTEDVISRTQFMAEVVRRC